LSADWSVGQAFLRVIYCAVFLPRITYASEIWRLDAKTRRVERLLGSKERRTLLSINGVYASTSTNVLRVLVGQFPLDLKIEWNALLKDSGGKGP